VRELSFATTQAKFESELSARIGALKCGPRECDVSKYGKHQRIAKGEPGGHHGIGSAFAPSSRLLGDFLRLKSGSGVLTDLEWARYSARFLAEMRASYRRNRPAWDELLRLDRVVLLCFCTDSAHCHRRILAEDVLPKLGATYAGELDWRLHK